MYRDQNSYQGQNSNRGKDRETETAPPGASGDAAQQLVVESVDPRGDDDDSNRRRDGFRYGRPSIAAR